MMSERSLMMTSVAYVEEQLQDVLESRANELARETGCIVRQRKLDGATIVQTLLFGFQQHPHASLEQLASTAQLRAVSVTDTAIDKRFSEACAQFLHAVLEEMSSVVVQAAQAVPLKLLKRFSAVICEESSTITLPDELADLWQGCGGTQAHTAAAVKVHTRLRSDAGALVGTQAERGTLRGSEQSIAGGGDGRQQSLYRGSRVLQRVALRGATGGRKLHAQSAARAHGAVHAAGRSDLFGVRAAQAGGSAQGAGGAGGRTQAASDALTAAAGAQNGGRPATQRLTR